MTAFWVIAGLMVLAGLVMVLPPLLWRSARQETTPEAANVAIYRERLAELEADLEEGSLDRAQYEEARRELEQGVLQDAGEARAGIAGSAARPSWAMSAVVAVALPVAAVALYLHLGAGERPEAAHRAADGGPSAEAMVRRLEARLQADPENSEGWRMLGRSYLALERFPEAVQALARARALAGDDAELLSQQAQALAMTRNGDLTGEPQRLLGRALELQPRHPEALWLAGYAAYQGGEHRKAIGYWETLLSQYSGGGDGEGAQLVRRHIEMAREQLAAQQAR
ncbi:MAG: c-type cytochrome biogenesis protein CcmI [Gammaproteobacteria bacterium]|nr:c-type cytochrome biogenesis protein CcmI [Gammaproteobacteria bacterium]NIR97308.1 c-type cytochrome biogenesis protein CcmI [Gammaproteobacteria bacterium]NIT63351.1 c-type cytochrome biogenesis protein CcmI [Gammaproteobacteria bacterium]NIV20278.1 c-type cytochrome biogenesis protein CcmI [Gammaproteobacteria bacterium]NIX10695.1 c-type cytochrome biogenesis protein CcmI [Gammaproteobacteria bacterium]